METSIKYSFIELGINLNTLWNDCFTKMPLLLQPITHRSVQPIIRNRLLLHLKVCHSIPPIVRFASQVPLVLNRPAHLSWLVRHQPKGTARFLMLPKNILVLDLAPQI